MSKVLAVDIDAMIYYESYKDNVRDALDGIDTRMERLFRETGCNNYVAFLTEGKCFRYDIAKSSPYKGSRKSEKPPLHNILKAYLKSEYNAISIDGIEADDAVMLMANNLVSSKVVICSPDKDVLLTYPGTHFNFQMTREVDGVPSHSKGFVTTTEAEAARFLCEQWIHGDSTDGIEGIKGVGPAKAAKILDAVGKGESLEAAILKAYTDKYGVVDGVGRFAETLKLVYMLRTQEDMMRETGREFVMPEIQTYIPKVEVVQKPLFGQS